MLISLYALIKHLLDVTMSGLAAHQLGGLTNRFGGALRFES